jgi:hypothetical protein
MNPYTLRGTTSDKGEKMNDDLRLASSAHEKVMLNLAVFNLLMPVAALSSGLMVELLSLSLFGSLSMMLWIYWRSHHTEFKGRWVKAHWLLAWRRCRLLLIAYFVSALIMGVGYLFGSMQADHNMFVIMLVVFSRVAAVPVVLMVLVLFVLETTSLSQARQGIPVNFQR